MMQVVKGDFAKKKKRKSPSIHFNQTNAEIPNKMHKTTPVICVTITIDFCIKKYYTISGIKQNRELSKRRKNEN